MRCTTSVPPRDLEQCGWSVLEVHLLIHSSNHLCHHHHSQYPLLLHSFTPDLKPTFSTNLSHLNKSGPVQWSVKALQRVPSREFRNISKLPDTQPKRRLKDACHTHMCRASKQCPSVGSRPNQRRVIGMRRMWSASVSSRHHGALQILLLLLLLLLL